MSLLLLLRSDEEASEPDPIVTDNTLRVETMTVAVTRVTVNTTPAD